MSEDLTLKINPSDITRLMRESILAYLTDGKKDALMKDALENVLKGNWNNPSEMQRAFSLGATQAINDIVRDEMKKPENQEKLRQVFAAAWLRTFEGDSLEELIKKLSNTMRMALTGERY